MARKNGISLSQLFEEIFKEGGLNPIKAEPQCAERLLQRLEKSESIPSQDDEVLIKAHVERKFTWNISPYRCRIWYHLKKGILFRRCCPTAWISCQRSISLQIAEGCIANLIYLSFDIYKLPDAASRLMDFVAACNVVNGKKPVILEALGSKFKDKEDAVLYYTALHSGADYFITRNTKDYKLSSSSLPVYKPLEFVRNISY